MMGKNTFTELITPSEAKGLMKHATLHEAVVTMLLCEEYYSRPFSELSVDWEFLQFLSFLYDTGRIQGIREERQKQRLKKKKVIMKAEQEHFNLTSEEEALLTGFRECTNENYKKAIKMILKISEH